MKNIIYSKGYPYGAPLKILRGAGTREIKEYLKEKGFIYDKWQFGWINYLLDIEFLEILKELKIKGYNIIPKKDIDKNYIYSEFSKKEK